MMTWLCDNLTRHDVMYDNIKGIIKRVCNTHHRLFNLSLDPRPSFLLGQRGKRGPGTRCLRMCQISGNISVKLSGYY